MKTVLLALMILVTACGVAAKPPTFTFTKYQVDTASSKIGEKYPLALLADLKAIISQSVELSPEGNGKAVATIGDSTVSLEVRAVPNKESRYHISVKHEFVSSYDGDIEITITHGTEMGGTFKVDEERVVSTLKSGVEDSVQTYVLVVKLTD